MQRQYTQMAVADQMDGKPDLVLSDGSILTVIRMLVTNFGAKNTIFGGP